jgi:membrane-associated phospholipid phosphatase
MKARLALLAGSSVVAVWLTYRALVTTRLGQRLDQRAMVESMWAAPVEANHLKHLLDVVSVPSIAVAVGALVVVSVHRGRPELGIAAATTVVGANLTAQVLKRWLDRPDLLGLGYDNSFPSGHVTVVASLAAGALIVAGRRARPAVVMVGAVAVAVTSLATVALGWHRPSDLVGAVGVVAAWATATASWAAGRAPARPSPGERVAVQSVG